MIEHVSTFLSIIDKNKKKIVIVGIKIEIVKLKIETVKLKIVYLHFLHSKRGEILIANSQS